MCCDMVVDCFLGFGLPFASFVGDVCVCSVIVCIWIPLFGVTWGPLVAESFGLGCLASNFCLYRFWWWDFQGVMSYSVGYCWFLAGDSVGFNSCLKVSVYCLVFIGSMSGQLLS